MRTIGLSTFKKVCFSCLLGGAVFAAQAQSVPDVGAPPVWESSPRRTPDAPPASAPDLPEAAGTVEPVTLDIRIESRDEHDSIRTTRRTASRTVDRIHMQLEGGREWLFLRNPVDPRRVSGYLVEPRSKMIIAYEESELRNALGIRGWADVLSLGFDAAILNERKLTEDSRMIDAMRFVRYEGSSADVWWNGQQALASEFTVQPKAGGPSTRLFIESISPGVDAELLQLPMSRFPGYKAVGYADSLEKHGH